MTTYSLTWHRDYAAEAIKRHELSKWSKDPNLEWAEYAVECAQVAQLALQVSEKIENGQTADIASTVLATIQANVAGGAGRNRSYRTITPKQRHALAVCLLERFGSARAIAGEVWQLTAKEIDEARV